MSRTKYFGAALIALLLLGGVAAWQSPLLPSRNIAVDRAPYVQNTSPTSAIIVWQTKTAVPTQLQWRASGRLQSWQNATQNGTRTQHALTLTNLQASSKYFYRVRTPRGWDTVRVLQTAKRAGQPFSFAVWGDSGVGSSAQKRLALQIENSRPDLLLHTGDLVYNRGEWKNFDPYFFRIYENILSRVPFYGALGNHDIRTQNGAPWLANLVLPRNGPRGVEAERNYYFDYADARFVVLDSNADAATLQKVAPWLESTLQASKARWKFVAFHHPAYSSGSYSDDKRIHKYFVPVFKRAGVDVVFNGHDHVYERIRPPGRVTYIVTGAGGAGRYKRRQWRTITQKFYNDDWSFTLVSLNQSTLVAQQITSSGRVVDQWSLKK